MPTAFDPTAALDAVVADMIHARHAAGLSQAALAQLMGTRQSALSEIESRAHPDFMLSTLIRYVAGTGGTLTITITAPGNPVPGHHSGHCAHPPCGRLFNLTRKGVVRYHGEPGTFPPARCPGSSKPPADRATGPDGPEMRYPTGRPGWLGEYQSWPCKRCGRDVDDSAPHACTTPHLEEAPADDAG